MTVEGRHSMNCGRVIRMRWDEDKSETCKEILQVQSEEELQIARNPSSSSLMLKSSAFERSVKVMPIRSEQKGQQTPTLGRSAVRFSCW